METNIVGNVEFPTEYQTVQGEREKEPGLFKSPVSEGDLKKSGDFIKHNVLKNGETVTGAENLNFKMASGKPQSSGLGALASMDGTPDGENRVKPPPENSEPKSESRPQRGRKRSLEGTTVSVATEDWLPEGWTVVTKVRVSGASAGTSDKYYIEDKKGLRFRSRKEVEYYLQTGEVRKKSNQTGDAQKKSNQTEEAQQKSNQTGEVEKKLNQTGEKRKKSNQTGEGGKKSNQTGEAQKEAKMSPDKTSGIPPIRPPPNFNFEDVPDTVKWVRTHSSDGWCPFIDGQAVPESSKREWAAAFEFLAMKSSWRPSAF